MAGAKARQVKFVGHDAAGLPVKRRQVTQACLPCRKRKKRCQHVPDAHGSSAVPTATEHHPETDNSGSDEPSPRKTLARRHSSHLDRDTSDAAAQLLRFFHRASDTTPADSPVDHEAHPPRLMSPVPPFLGDLNPEGILVEATMPPVAGLKAIHTEEEPDHQRVGFLPPTSPRDARQPEPPASRDRSAGSPKLLDDMPGPVFSVPKEDGSLFTIRVQDTAKFAALARALATRGLADKVLPSAREWNVMRNIYITKIHPIFPIYDESTLLDLPEEPGLCELIQATVCLAASTDPEAQSSLAFRSHADVGPDTAARMAVPYDKYSREVADFINKRLAELQETRRISLVEQIQVMSLTCLYWQPADTTERFEPLSLYARLVALVHTHGIHLDLLSRAKPGESPSETGSGSRVFKCLYALDRLLGTMAGRPLLFHNYDLMRVPRPEPDDAPIFRLFMSLILLLDQVTELYRPNPKISYVDIPVFEHMAIDAGAECEAEILLVTLEVLYHAIGVLSVRMPRHRFRTAPECDTLPGPRTQHLPPSSMNARRSHGTDRILDVIKDYKLSPMPFVPYALALSLGVAYRKWRFSRLPMFRTRGGADFKRVLPVLQDLGAIWSSARINGQLGQAVVLKLDRNEILSRKRTRKTPEATAADNESAGPGPNSSRHGTDPNPATDGQHSTGTDDVGRPGGTSAFMASPSAHLPVLPVEANSEDHSNAGNPEALQSGVHDPRSLPSPATSSLTEPSQLPLPKRTNPIGSDNNLNFWSNNTSLARQIPTEQPPALTSSQAYLLQDDAIPLPTDMLAQQPGDFCGTSPFEGISDGNVDDFLVDDDALFRAWDPRFALSVDFSFSSILDPGNPFAWPEYCSYML